MNPATFLHNCERIITGYPGLKISVPGIDLTSLRDADCTILTGATEPDVVTHETHFVGLASTAGQTDLGNLTFLVPRDYDQSVDKMRIRFLANSAGDTDTPTIDATCYRKRAGSALSADLDPTISAAVNNSTALAGWVEVKLEGESLRPGDVISLDFTASAHATDALNLYALEVVYYSCFVYFEEDERNDWA